MRMSGGCRARSTTDELVVLVLVILHHGAKAAGPGGIATWVDVLLALGLLTPLASAHACK